MNAIRIIGLTILAILALSPMVMAINPHLVLTSQLFSQTVTLAYWQRTVSGPCSLTPIFTAALNFTENLAGRDSGSTWVQFRFPVSQVPYYLVERSVITPQFMSDFPCTVIANSPVVLAIVAVGTTYWRVQASGNYTLVGLSNNIVFAKETWTVTTIS